jgi:hypothetical protein
MNESTMAAMTRMPRRSFLAAAGTLSVGALAPGRRTAAAEPVGRFVVRGREANGALAQRIALTASRLTGPGVPAFTEDFVLADVRLDPRRRFTNYAGDLSGRYIEALTLLPPPGRSADDLRPLVRALIEEQKADGRFGRTDLRFTRDETGVDHMPLLWGNGRLLVGLATFHAATGDSGALAAARRLGDFLIGVQAAAGHPEVVERVEKAGAAGLICFTQLNEGLILLWQATRDERCLAAARAVAGLLRPRGAQHSHGYLTTLRGALMLHEATGDRALLAAVEREVADLLASDDYLIDGGTHEFFGWDDPANAGALAAARHGSGDDGRNEGCSLADLVRLTLHLHRVTGKATYLDVAEACWVNAFSHNQFASGDFGHRAYFPHGYKPVPNLARAWWCCTMHGYRCYADVLESAAAAADKGIRIHLFEDMRLTGDSAVSIEAAAFGGRVRFDRAFDGALAVRVPAWAERAHLVRGGSRAEPLVEEGYVRLRGPFAAGEAIDVALTPRIRVRTRDRRHLPLASIPTEATRGGLLVGPYVMAVMEEAAPDFFGEPWSGREGDRPEGNVVRLDASLATRVTGGRWPRIETTYEHDGFPGRHPLTLRALGSRPALDQQIHAFWLNFARA